VFVYRERKRAVNGGGRVGKKAGQGLSDRVGKKARVFLLVRAALMSRPIPFSQNVSPHNPYRISREKQTASSLFTLWRILQ